MKKISEEVIKAIKDDYRKECLNNSFVDDILCMIVDENTFSIKSVDLPYCEGKEQQKFWSDCLSKDSYLHLFPFLILSFWQHNNSEIEILNSWIKSFKSDFKAKILEEADLFKRNSSSCKLSSSTLINIGFLIDKYLWEEKLDAPFYVEFLKNRNLLQDKIYDSYVSFFKNYLENCNISLVYENMDELLEFSNKTDNVMSKSECFLSIVNKFTKKRLECLDLKLLLTETSHNNNNIIILKKIISFFCINANRFGAVENNFPFCETVKEDSFWYSNKKKYDTLLLYAALTNFFPSTETEYWVNIIQRDYTPNLEYEMHEILRLYYNKDSINLPIVNSVVFIVERYMWENYLEVPYLITKSTYNNYKNVFLQFVKSHIEESKKNVDKCLQYCLLFDTVTLNDISLLTEFLLILFPNIKTYISGKVISEIPFVDDAFNFVLLQYCKDNASLYGFLPDFLNRLQFSYEYNSWMNEINRSIESTGRPYNVKLSKATDSHRKIIEFLNSRHSAFFNKCHQSILEMVDVVKATSSTTKQYDLKEKIKEKIKNRCNEEKLSIISEITQLVKDARHEAFFLYINEIRDAATLRGKNIPLTENVISSIIRTLSTNYDDSEIPTFTIPSITLVDEYENLALIVSSIWVKHNLFSPDEMNYINTESDYYKSRINEAITNSVWQDVVCLDVYYWCEKFYDQGVIHPYSYSNYYDDSSNESSLDYTMGFAGVVGG